MTDDQSDKAVNRWASRTNRRGSKNKRTSELRPTTFRKYVNLGKLPYSPLFRDSVRDLFEFPLSDSARLTWLRLQPLFANRLSPGYLIDERDNKPVSSDFLAAIWRKEKSEVDRDLEELTKFLFLRKDCDVFCDATMVSSLEDDESHNKPNDNDLNNSPQLTANKLSQSRVKKSKAEQSKANALLIEADNSTASHQHDANAVLTTPLVNKDEGSVAEVPSLAPSEPTTEQLNAHRDEWVEWHRTAPPMSMRGLTANMEDCGAHPDIISDALKCALGLSKRAIGSTKVVSATLREYAEDRYCGIDWIPLDSEKAA
jgi:hypothetical protein